MKFLRWAGLLLSVVGVVFVIVRLADYAGDLAGFRPAPGQLAALALLGTVYGASNIALAFAWRDLLEHCGTAVSRRWAVPVYGLTQLAKYVPGNFFHLAGRVSLGVADGHASGPLVRSAFWELGTIATAAVAYAVWLLPALPEGFGSGIAALAFAIVLVALCIVAERRFSRHVRRALLWHAGFLFVSGAVFFATLGLLVPTAGLLAAFPVIAGAYIIAWLAGALTPGAPAGLGIREVVLLALLDTLVAPSQLLVAVVLNRVVTTGGDALFYLYALTVSRKE